MSKKTKNNISIESIMLQQNTHHFDPMKLHIYFNYLKIIITLIHTTSPLLLKITHTLSKNQH